MGTEEDGFHDAQPALRGYALGYPVSNSTPHGWHTVTPRIFTGDVAGLVGFLKAVFNATGEYRAGMPAEIIFAGSS